jgi:formate dehydrogenase alpha subunit
MTNSIDEIEDAKCIVVIGSNTTSQHPMIASRVMRAKEKGATLIVIDPRRVPLTEYADLFLQVKPGTNIALINGMLKVLMEKGLVDEAFIKERTEGFEELKDKVRSYPLDEVAKITGVDPDLIEKAAVLYAEAETGSILYAMGVTQHTTGTDNVLSVANLAMATGNLGRPSTGVNPLRGQNNVQGACDVGALPNVMTGYQPVADEAVRKRFAEAWGMPVPEKPGLTVVEMFDRAREGKIKGMLVVGENPVLSDPDSNHVREALEALSFLVVQDIFMTETARHAHIVLPACSFAEKDGTVTGTDRRVQRVRQAISPLGESRTDWQIIADLAKEMGAGDFDYASAGDIMKEIASVTPSYGGVSFERLDRGEVLQWPCPDEKHPGTPFLHKDGFVRGKGRFHAVDYVEPGELPDKEYPLLLTTGRVPFHFHTGSMTRRIERLDSEVPTGLVDVCPEDALRLGIKEGEIVKVSSRRGEITIRVRVSDEVDPGVVFVPMHFAECAANVLTDTKLDAKSKIPPFKTCAVRIEKTS